MAYYNGQELLFSPKVILSGGFNSGGVSPEELEAALTKKANIYEFEEQKEFKGSDVVYNCSFTLTKEIIEAGYFEIVNNNASGTISPYFYTITFGDYSYEVSPSSGASQDVEYGKPFKFIPDLNRLTAGDGVFGEDYWREGTKVVVNFLESAYEDEFDVSIIFPTKKIDVKDSYLLAEENAKKLQNTEDWVFTLEDGTEVTKRVVLG